MSQIKPPDPLDFRKADTRWPDWKRRFERYRIATKLFKEDDDIQISTLLCTMGNESEYVFTHFALDEKEAKGYGYVISKFDEHFRLEKMLFTSGRCFIRDFNTVVNQPKLTYEVCMRWLNIVI